MTIMRLTCPRVTFPHEHRLRFHPSSVWQIVCPNARGCKTRFQGGRMPHDTNSRESVSYNMRLHSMPRCRYCCDFVKSRNRPLCTTTSRRLCRLIAILFSAKACARFSRLCGHRQYIWMDTRTTKSSGNASGEIAGAPEAQGSQRSHVRGLEVARKQVDPSDDKQEH